MPQTPEEVSRELAFSKFIGALVIGHGAVMGNAIGDIDRFVNDAWGAAEKMVDDKLRPAMTGQPAPEKLQPVLKLLQTAKNLVEASLEGSRKPDVLETLNSAMEGLQRALAVDRARG